MAGTVTVASKLPFALRLQLQRNVEHREPVGGGKIEPVTRSERVGKVVIIAGFAHPADKAPTAPLVEGYALTHGVDADFFAAWMQQNAELPAVELGFIYGHEKPNTVDSYARDRKGWNSGFEPVDPDNLPLEFSRSIETANTRR